MRQIGTKKEAEKIGLRKTWGLVFKKVPVAKYPYRHPDTAQKSRPRVFSLRLVFIGKDPAINIAIVQILKIFCASKRNAPITIVQKVRIMSKTLTVP